MGLSPGKFQGDSCRGTLRETEAFPVGTLLLPGDYQLRNSRDGGPGPVSGIIIDRYEDKWSSYRDSYQYRILLSNGNVVRQPAQWILDLFEVVI